LTTVCQLTTVHQPFDVRIFHKTAVSAAKAGYASLVVAPHGKDEWVDGVRLLGIGRPRGRVARMLAGAADCLRRAGEADADLYQFHDPELIRVGLALKRRGKQVVYDVHESHAESVLDRAYLPPWIRSFVSRRVAAAERAADARLDAVVAATPKIARQFRNPRTVLVQNFPLLAEVESGDGPPFAGRETAAVFVGGISSARGAHQMVEAAGLVPGLRLLLVGEFSPAALRGELQALEGWEQCEPLGWLDRRAAQAAMGRARAGVAVFQPLRNHTESQPNKLFEYMAAGLPVVASDFPHWRSLLGPVQCAEFSDPASPSAIAEALARLVSDPSRAQEMGARGREAVRAEFNWEAQGQALLALYRELVGPPV
jgi:glycosyltransferase involved in cell wall biosynthesis